MGNVLTATSLALIAGRPAVTKARFLGRGQPTGTDHSAPLRHATEAEGRWLGEARHPNVVQLRWVAPDEATLITDLAGLQTLRTHRHPPPLLAEVLANVAGTLAELHRRGLPHGNIDATHVVLAGRELTHPVLCSPRTTSGADQRGDVIALADLAHELTIGLGSGRWSGSGRLTRRRAARWQATIERLRQPSTPSASAAADCFSELAR